MCIFAELENTKTNYIMAQVKFNPMKSKNFWDRPEFLKTGYTFRNGGGEGDFVFTLLEDFDPKNIHANIRVLCHCLSNGYTHEETWDDCEYLDGSFKNHEYFPYWQDCEWLKEYYN